MRQLTQKQYNFLSVLFFTFPFVWGLYYEFAACLAGIVLWIFLAVCYNKNKKIVISVGLPHLFILALPFFMMVSVIWSIDKGMTFGGALKFLNIVPFLLLMTFVSDEERRGLQCIVPYSGAAMTLVSVIAYFTPLRDYFFMADRLGGFFQYSNTFALFLLIGIVIASNREIELKNAILLAVLLLGIIFTGSRSIFLFLVVYIIAFAVKNRKDKMGKILLGALAVLVVVSAVLVLVTGNSQLFGRFWTISLKNSTMLGRLLYYLDGLKMLIRHPYGIGVNGYQYLSCYEQTGVYFIKYIHNDLLQLGIDCGILVLIAGIIAFIAAVCDKRITFVERSVLIIVGFHSLLDFDLQYIAVVFVLIVCMNCKNKKEIKLRNVSCVLCNGVIALFCIALLWEALAYGLNYFDKYEAASKLMPFYTTAKINEMNNADGDEKYELAKQVIALNKYNPDAEALLAEEAFKKNDYEGMIEHQNNLLDGAAYSIEYYEECLLALSVAMQNSIDAGDEEMGMACAEAVLKIEERLDEVKDRTSSLAWKIKDKPNLELSKQYQNYVDTIKKVLGNRAD